MKSLRGPFQDRLKSGLNMLENSNKECLPFSYFLPCHRRVIAGFYFRLMLVFFTVSSLQDLKLEKMKLEQAMRVFPQKQTEIYIR